MEVAEASAPVLRKGVAARTQPRDEVQEKRPHPVGVVGREVVRAELAEDADDAREVALTEPVVPEIKVL